MSDVARKTIVVTALLAWPLLPGIPYDAVNTGILAAEYLIVALSLVLLIGIVGQISLCQAAFVGIGAFLSAIATKRLGVPFPFTLGVGILSGAVAAGLIGVVALRVRGLYLAVATLIFAYIADKYLFAQPWLVENQSGTSIPLQAIGRPGTIPYFDLADAHVFYYVAVAVAAISLYGVANLRDSRVGRAFAAVRGSEVAAASLGIGVTRYKLLGFACAGALAGLGGSVTLIGARTVAPTQFDFMGSLYFLAIAVVGGLRSLGGAIASALLFAVLVGEVFFRSPQLADYLDVISSGVLIVVLLFFRGGLGAVGERSTVIVERLRGAVMRALRQIWPHRELALDGGVTQPRVGAPARALDAARGWVASVRNAVPGVRRGHPESDGNPSLNESRPIDVISLMERVGQPAKPRTMQLRVEHFDDDPDDEVSGGQDDNGAAGRSVEQLLTAVRNEVVPGHLLDGGRREPVLLQAEHITVRFGGLTAVSDVSLQVGAGEIVGLIGPNGAGKTTLFNSILGLNVPTAGEVSLFGRSVTDWEVHRRAALGVGRTFQILQLFGDLTVSENLLVATHLQHKAGLWGALAVPPGTKRSEQAARARVRAVLQLMELEDLADRKVGGLPFGVLRLVEVARTLVTGARLVCFDEPASGLDSRETERLIEWFRVLRRIGITLLVIEHDVDMVVRLCDWIYVLDQGRLIADGPPERIRRDPNVIASYLGAPMEVA
ncbi:MAG TPA: branched-chain amino acid ABC transporter ATP-binding protein/permease [Candidatus Dormibacteraeota bacterium]|jgi:ABC-type branched-subunit amino acid transport system ATPase component/ABC-type branched-subunit amino acid transport system permease subunit|nr:branched-chain amino acid ABC transporter ATP-binding protein/permease [Candidatus Dormibacteraeota bacterium]